MTCRWRFLATLALSTASLFAPCYSAWAQQPFAPPPTSAPAAPWSTPGPALLAPPQSVPSATTPTAQSPFVVAPVGYNMPVQGASMLAPPAVGPAAPLAAAPAPLAEPSMLSPPTRPAAYESSAYVSQLEQRLLDLETRLEKVELLDAADTAPAVKPADAPKVVGADLDMTAKWNHGVEFKSKDGGFRIHVGGRTQLDAVWLTQEAGALDGAGGVGAQDSVNFRRARFRVDGTWYDLYEFAAEFDFVNSTNIDPTLPATENNVAYVTAPTDLWWQIKQMPYIGNLRIGNMKEPIGLEHQNSSRYLDFMERSYLQDAYTGPFNNGFTPGIMASNNYSEEMGLWQIGLFKNTQNVFAYDVGDGEGAVTGRLTRLLWYDEPTDGRYLCHVAISGSTRDPDQDRLRIRSRMSLRNGPGGLNPNIADTGFFTCTGQQLIGAEWAMVAGPWHFQAEYIGSYTNNTIGNGNGAAIGTPLGTVYTSGYYVQATYFLTGEHRVYERKEGRFGRVIPHENAYLVGDKCDWCFTRGAWQLGARYDYLDLSDNGLDGGIIQDVTLGVNWFLNPNFKIQANYVYTHRNARNSANSGDIDGVGIRVAHDF